MSFCYLLSEWSLLCGYVLRAKLLELLRSCVRDPNRKNAENYSPFRMACSPTHKNVAGGLERLSRAYRRCFLWYNSIK